MGIRVQDLAKWVREGAWKGDLKVEIPRQAEDRSVDVSTYYTRAYLNEKLGLESPPDDDLVPNVLLYIYQNYPDFPYHFMDMKGQRWKIGPESICCIDNPDAGFDEIYEPVTIINIGAELESIIRTLEPEEREGEKRVRYNQLLITNDYEPDWKNKEEMIETLLCL